MMPTTPAPGIPDRPLRIAMIGTRGVPAAYGGFETAVEEIGARMVRDGHRVLVYARNPEPSPNYHRGMRVVDLPALRTKSAETLSHSALSALHTVMRAKPDVAFVFNAANAPILPLLRSVDIPVATHVDGLEWKRTKWGPQGKRYYLWAERASVRWSDALIADAPGIADYYRNTYDADTVELAYGAPLLTAPGSDLLPGGLESRQYHLVVSRFEPENHVLEIVRGYARSQARHPLVVVGAAPFAERYTQQIEKAARGDERISLLGRVDDQDVLDQLYGNARTYLHGHSVGGTNPSLLRAMGAACDVLAFDVTFNREVAGPDACYFSTPAELAALVELAELEPEMSVAAGRALQKRAAERYRWDDVAEGYLALARGLVQDNGR